MRAAWMAGDFGVIAKTVAGAAVEFVNGLDVPAGARVLDVACGTGNSAIPMARRGAQVTGVDIATNLLAQGRDRAAAEGVTVAFDEGDAEQLPYGDATFDAIVTMFGAMFAPRPELVAAEFARVLKPGGLLAMANWHPSSFAGKMFQVTSRHAPPPPGLTAPVLWGDDKTVRARLGQDFEGMATEIVPVLFDMPTSPAGAVLFFRTYFGPTQMAFNRLDAAGQQALATDLENLFAGANTAMDRPDHTIVQNEFLKVTARRK
ncbi:MAG TPA: class I SAM-dependent methyltransferase [Terracidiphilus sp.]